MTYRERLWPAPALLISLLLLIPATILVFLPINPEVGVVVAVALYLAGTGVLLAMSPTITVDPQGLTVGPAHLSADAIGAVSHCTGEDATAERGTRLDARAWLVIRGGIPAVVRIEVSDEKDPTPYWLVASRRPTQLAAAVEQIRPRTPGR